MAGIAFTQGLEFKYGQVEHVAENVRRLVLPNPGAFTYYGTGVYIVGQGNVAIIDPGPAIPAYTNCIMAAMLGETVSALLITHTHLDHSPGAAALKELTGAPTYGFGPHGGGRDLEDVEAGADHDFKPDFTLKDGQSVEGSDWKLTAIHTPGHTSNHLCYALDPGNAVFTGDHVMGWSTTIVSPPDGDMTAYLASLDKLTRRGDTIYYPTHGAPITNPVEYVQSLISHRLTREAQIREAIAEGKTRISAMVPIIYDHLPQEMYGAAARSVLSHLVKMVSEGTVLCEDNPPNQNSDFCLV